MQKIILDTNVVISSLLSNSYPAKIIYEVVYVKDVDICLSTQVLKEYVDVFKRKKFFKYPDFINKADTLLSKLNELSHLFEPTVKIELLSDPSDNKFLELASASSADFLITGNTNHFKLKEFEYTRIVSPKEYWDYYKP